MSHIQEAIRELEAKKKDIDRKLTLLRSALGGKPKPAEPKVAKRRARKPKVDNREYVLDCLKKIGGNVKLPAILEKTGLPKAQTREALEQLVNDGLVIQSGNRRSLSFLPREGSKE